MTESSAPPAWCRPALHAGTGLGALLLGVLPYPWAVFCAGLGVLAGWVLFRFTIERYLRRPGEPFFGGLRTYPLAVLLLVIFLPAAEAAAAWMILAFGDVAAAVVGTRVRAPSIFGHPKATWSGSLALLVVGTVAAFLTASVVGWLGSTVGTVDVGPVPSLLRCALAALAATLIDLVPIPPDDNLPAGGAAGLMLALTRALGG